MRSAADPTERRRRAMSAFAQAPAGFLEARWPSLADGRTIVPVRGPEVGLVMVRGRTGGGGAAFNLGEASATRASVRLANGPVGHAMILGRDLEKARHAAAFDALWQIDTCQAAVEREVVAEIERLIAAADGQRAEETAATKVDFFTMARGED
ncbi:phosphonate C-P lyase system protein PhnG [Jiella sp. MQZ9-1]|uniref:Phosphonate C-P lyase system protein PhnG n=1 Tax=Jiella flava TaxID=2816857 RepID=A0A939G154_9HYPH|nr:phosphonate C-P lyase system protein PhnG [Jiella flava]MBO0663134.1 phosphonate C-P lyase system protein PhnG [Jiella flava]MCD2471553.1 phosphonate C-P lyase system protein PhnG [Jiella flava]